jgi:hypothetical protein
MFYNVDVHESQYTGNHAPSPPEQLDSSADSQTHTPAARLSLVRKLRRAWNYGWVAEILCCVLGIVSLIAIVITLRLHQGKPLPRWPLGITINALIATSAMLMKAGLTVPLSEGSNRKHVFRLSIVGYRYSIFCPFINRGDRHQSAEIAVVRETA